MARTSTATSRTTKKATSAAKTVARKTAGAARDTATAAKRATSTAKKTAKKSVTGAAKKSSAAAKKSATAAKRRSPSTPRSPTRGPDALQVLIEDHRTVEELFKKFEGLGSRANKSRGDIAAKVIEELSVHAVVEEQAFYPAVRRIQELEDEVLEALEEHHVVKWVLSELEKMSPTDERFEAKFTVMMENVRHHVEEEEGDMFPQVRRAMSSEQLEALGTALQEAKKTAPRRPHPRSPDTPPGNLIAAAVSAPIDMALNAGKDAVQAVRNFATGNN